MFASALQVLNQMLSNHVVAEKYGVDFLEFASANPHEYVGEFWNFGIWNVVQTRMNIDFWYRSVTPGVAGSSPVHSAKKMKNRCKSPIYNGFLFSESTWLN